MAISMKQRLKQEAIAWADYGFEYSDEEVQEEDVDIENQYYNSKGALSGSPVCLQASLLWP